MTQPARKPAPPRPGPAELELELIVDATPESDRGALERLADLLDRMVRAGELSKR